MKGISVLALHRPFNLAKGIAVDDLHCIFLGVTSDLLHYWFDKTFRGKQYSIRAQVRKDTCNRSFYDLFQTKYFYICKINVDEGV